jgi:hypothetical protein
MNKSSIFLWVCLNLISIISNGQRLVDPYGYGSEQDFKRLVFLNNQYIQSWIRSDTATYNRLLWAEDFVHQNSSNGRLYSKQKTAEIFGRPRFESIDYFYPVDIAVHFISPTAAMVFAKTPLRLKNEQSEANSQYNDVYVNRDGQWICVSANVVALTKPGDVLPVVEKTPELVEIPSAYPVPASDRSILTELNAQHAEAFLKCKPEQVRDILADDFILLASNGLLSNKTEVLQQIERNKSGNTIASYQIENLVIRLIAPEVAMVQAAVISTRRDGRTWGVQYNDIYVKRENRWLCVSGNNTPIRN